MFSLFLKINNHHRELNDRSFLKYYMKNIFLTKEILVLHLRISNQEFRKE